MIRSGFLAAALVASAGAASAQDAAPCPPNAPHYRLTEHRVQVWGGGFSARVKVCVETDDGRVRVLLNGAPDAGALVRRPQGEALPACHTATARQVDVERDTDGPAAVAVSACRVE